MLRARRRRCEAPGKGRQVWTTARFSPFSQSGGAPGSACPRPSPCASPVLLFLCRSPRMRSCAHRPLPLRPSRLHLPPWLRLLRLARRPLSSERSVSARTPLLCLLVPFMKRLRHHVSNVPLSCRWQPREQSPATAAASEGGRSGGGTEKRERDPERQNFARAAEGAAARAASRGSNALAKREANGLASDPKGAWGWLTRTGRWATRLATKDGSAEGEKASVNL